MYLWIHVSRDYSESKSLEPIQESKSSVWISKPESTDGIRSKIQRIPECSSDPGTPMCSLDSGTPLCSSKTLGFLRSLQIPELLCSPETGTPVLAPSSGCRP